MSIELSVVVPVYNEQENIAPLTDSVCSALEASFIGKNYELIFIDDGSRDQTVAHILKLNGPIRLIQFSRNYGQTSAIAAGIAEARGKYIVTLDGDLQNDPSDIPMMLSVLKEKDLDIVAGRRLKRQDGMFLRKIPSKIANWLVRKVTKTSVRDLGCTLKLFRADLAKKLDLYGELHRFIPVLGAIYGARIGEVDVKHHSRRFGTSKYGLGRTFRVASDILLMFYFIKYRQRPMHLFGTLGMWSLLIGGLIELYLLILKIMGNDIGGRPLFYVGILLILAGIQFITTGFLAELMMRTYFASEGKKPYTILRKFEGGREVEN